MSKECFLRSVEGLHPDIVLKDGVALELGRGPVTKIKEARCSRKQVSLISHLDLCTVECTQMGGNPSKVGGRVLKMGSSATLRHREVLELLSGQYKYSVIFNPPPPPIAKTEKGEENGLKRAEDKHLKRKLSHDSSTAESRSPKRTLTGRSDSSDHPFWFTPETPKSIQSKGSFNWMTAYEGRLLTMRTEKVDDSEKIAAFDLDGTIIGTKSGKVFAVDKNDWKIFLSEVPGKLKSLVSQGFKVVFITNQAGIAKGKLKQEDFQEKVERIISRLGVPVQVVCSTSEGGFFRKPRTGIWRWLAAVGNGGRSIDMSESFYCGDAAGRTAEWNFNPKTKKDFSCSDRLFATNNGLKFYTPEEFFMNKAPTPNFTMPGFDPKQDFSGLHLLQPETEALISKHQEMVILVGIQGSGKSHVARKLESEGYIVASNDRSGGKDKSLRIAREGLSSGKKVVVDNTHRDVDSRKDYIKLANEASVPVRCFMMKTSHEHARHNNIYRELIDPSHTKIKEMLFNSYRSRFEAPTLAEGFSSLVEVNFVPSFKDDQHRNLYQSYLLEK